MESNNKAHMEYVLNELNNLTNPINSRNEFKGKFTIEESRVEGLIGTEDKPVDCIELNLSLVYTQLHLDGTEYTPNLSEKILRKKYFITHSDVEEAVINFTNNFYTDLIRSFILGTYGEESFIGHFIKNGLAHEQA